MEVDLRFVICDLRFEPCLRLGYSGGVEGPVQSEVALEEACQRFYSDALKRIRRVMLVLGAAGVVSVTAIYGVALGAGLLVGCVIAWANFYWLEQIVKALADRVTRSGQSESGRGVFARFLLRYAVIAVAAYVIFSVSLASLYGLLGGLFLTVAAILCEAGYEAWVALRRGL